MTRTHTAAVVLTVLLVAGLLAPPAVRGQSTADVVTIDADHGLTDRDAIEGYEDDGIATATRTVPDVRLTVAEDHEDVDLGGFRLDADKRYLRIQYNESLTKTLRIYVPAEYFYPITAEDDTAVNADVTADFAPTASGRYTSMTVRFEGQTDAVWTIPKAASFVFWGRAKSREVVANTTGYRPPQIGANGTWAYVPDGALDGEASYPINTTGEGLTMQYDSAGEGPAGEPTWVSVPDCDGGSAPVCQYTKAGVDDQVFVLSKTDDPPPVRWQRGKNLRASGSSIINDLGLIPDRIKEDLSGIFGWEVGK